MTTHFVLVINTDVVLVAVVILAPFLGPACLHIFLLTLGVAPILRCLARLDPGVLLSAVALFWYRNEAASTIWPFRAVKPTVSIWISKSAKSLSTNASYLSRSRNSEIVLASSTRPSGFSPGNWQKLSRSRI